MRRGSSSGPAGRPYRRARNLWRPFRREHGAFTDEARRWRDWFVTVCVGLPDHLHIMYEVDGERLPSERKIPWLAGFEHSTPVQIANGANTQFQLGVCGHVLMSFEHGQRAGIAFEAEHWTLIESVMRHVARVWQRPGNGIWERRDGGRQ